MAPKTDVIEQLQAKVAELGAEVERLKRTNSSYANLTKAQESQLTNLRQRLYQLKGADSAIDSERQANCDLTEQLAAEQLNNKLLRDALEAVIKVHGYESGIPVEAISTQASTEALDKYVAEKVKEAGKFDMWKTNPYTKVLETSIEQLTKQRDLTVEALENCRLLAARHRKEEWAGHIMRFCKDAGLSGSPIRNDSIKESENNKAS